MDKGYFERIVPHEMWCAMYGPYPMTIAWIACPVKIVRELEAENRRLEKELGAAKAAFWWLMTEPNTLGEAMAYADEAYGKIQQKEKQK